ARPDAGRPDRVARPSVSAQSRRCRPLRSRAWRWRDVPSMSTPLRGLVGDKTAKALEKGLGLRSCGDLLRHYPRRYVERGVLTPLTDLREDEKVTVQADIDRVSTYPFRN